MISNYIFIPVRDIKEEPIVGPDYFAFIVWAFIILIIYLFNKWANE